MNTKTKTECLRKSVKKSNQPNRWSPLVWQEPFEISEPNLKLLQTRLNGLASLLAAVDMGVLKLTTASALNVRDELLNLTQIIENELEIPF